MSSVFFQAHVLEKDTLSFVWMGWSETFFTKILAQKRSQTFFDGVCRKGAYVFQFVKGRLGFWVPLPLGTAKPAGGLPQAAPKIDPVPAPCAQQVHGVPVALLDKPLVFLRSQGDVFFYTKLIIEADSQCASRRLVILVSGQLEPCLSRRPVLGHGPTVAVAAAEKILGPVVAQISRPAKPGEPAVGV